jgi:DNA-binding HxlR family transcriptional regulator
MQKTSFADMHCSLGRTLELVGDWWSPLILRDLALGLSRFDELAEDLGISRNLLTMRLNAMVEGGVISRERTSSSSTRHRYALTTKGRDLIPIFAALTAWGDKWATPEHGPPIYFGHRDCCERTQPQVCCSACQQPIHPDDLTMHAGPGARPTKGTKLIGARATPPATA